MKRYLAFGGEYDSKPYLGDFIGSYADLVIAKAAVDVCDPEGFSTYLQGCVLDTNTGKIHEFYSRGTASGELGWKHARQLEGKV